MNNKTGSKSNVKKNTVWICTTSLFMALNIIMSSYGVPVPGGHLYMCDVIICAAAICVDPFSAFCVGGIGSMLGDMIFYPLTMFVSLVTHGLQAVVISICSHYMFKNKPVLASGIGVALGSVIMVTGYTFGAAFIYSTPAYAITKLPYEFLQAIVGAVLGMIICWKLGLKKLINKIH